jgi:DNA polymerase III subunit alpha
VFEYIKSTYVGQVASIATISTLSSKSVIKEVSKLVCGFEEYEANNLSDKIEREHGIVADLKDVAESNPEFKNWTEEWPHAFAIALKLENLNKNLGKHASGVAICSQPLENICPLSSDSSGNLITGYDMKDVADLMVKFDVLGLKTLTVAQRTCQLLNINLDDIDPNDPSIYQALQDLQYPEGLFQISAPTNFRVCQHVRPANLSELSDVVAIARPGALAFMDDYVKNAGKVEFG